MIRRSAAWSASWRSTAPTSDASGRATASTDAAPAPRVSAIRYLSGWTILVPALVFGAGMGAALNSLFASYMAHTSPEQAGSASGILNTTIQLGTATGIALFGTLYFTAVGQGSETATAYSLLAAAALLAVGLALTPAMPKATTATPATATPDTTVQAHEGVR